MNDFKDLLVIETAGVLAGPSVGMFFAELGARVIKIENKRSGGDMTRKWKLPTEDPRSPVSAYFSGVNWGKEHRMLDLKDMADRAAFDALLNEADVLITNHLPQDDAKLGLQKERLRALNPRLIHGHISGYRDDPERPAYDVVLQAEVGYLSMTGTSDAMAKLPIAMIDILAGHQLKEGLLIALMQRTSNGQGAYVEASLEEAALAGMINQASNQLMVGHVAQRLGTLHPNIAPYGEMLTCQQNGQVILAVGSDKQFALLCQVLGVPDLAQDERFRSNTLRVGHRKELIALLQRPASGMSAAALLSALSKSGVPAGAVRTVDQVLATPVAKEMILAEEIDGVRTLRLKGNAFRIETHPTD